MERNSPHRKNNAVSHLSNNRMKYHHCSRLIFLFHVRPRRLLNPSRSKSNVTWKWDCVIFSSEHHLLCFIQNLNIMTLAQQFPENTAKTCTKRTYTNTAISWNLVNIQCFHEICFLVSGYCVWQMTGVWPLYPACRSVRSYTGRKDSKT
jgi:hypothetical protein